MKKCIFILFIFSTMVSTAFACSQHVKKGKQDKKTEVTQVEQQKQS